MWSGRIVPLLRPLQEQSQVYKPLAPKVTREVDSYDPAESRFYVEPEELRLLLPEDLCFGTGIRDGSSVYVGYQWNPPLIPLRQAYKTKGMRPNPLAVEKSVEDWLERYSREVAAWIIVSPFPIEMLPVRIMELIVRLTNQPGSFLKAVVEPAAKNSATLLQVEGMTTGDESSLVMFPDSRSMDNFITALKKQVGDDKPLVKFSARVPKAVEKKYRKKNDSHISDLGWIEDLVSPDLKIDNNQWGAFKARISEVRSRKIMVRDRMILVPWGEIMRGYAEARDWYSREPGGAPRPPDEDAAYYKDFRDNAQPVPEYALLVRDADLPVVLGVIPRGMLFQLSMHLRTSGMFHSTSESFASLSSVQAVCGVFEKSGINIWHIQQLPSQMTFTERPASKLATTLECSYMESDLRIVAACPSQWLKADSDSLLKHFKVLRATLAKLRVPSARAVGRLNVELPKPKDIWDAVFKAILPAPKSRIPRTRVVKGCDLVEYGWRLLDALDDKHKESSDKTRSSIADCTTWLRDFLSQHGEPLVGKKEDIVIHAPPFLRIFFSHSANPAKDELDYIIQIKELLRHYAVEIVEGQFTAGLSTDELSRGRIRLCTALVSFFWPREDFKNKEGQFLPAEWVSHEESFALGLGLRVVRIVELDVTRPRYEYDRPAIEFRRGDSVSWTNAKDNLQKQVSKFVLEEAQRLSYRPN